MEEIVKLPSRDEFAEHVNTAFTADADGVAPFDMILLDVRDVYANERFETFTLAFRAPVDAPPSQGIFKLDHPALGPMELFLVPHAIDADGLYYDAVFNLLVEQKMEAAQ